jgi:molybdopterin synthase sulfur carrier subunit
VKVFYFAWLKSKTGIGEEDVDPPADAEALGDPAAVRCAVNQDYARDDHPVSASDEIAFFPPVTGG